MLKFVLFKELNKHYKKEKKMITKILLKQTVLFYSDVEESVVEQKFSVICKTGTFSIVPKYSK